MNTMAKNPATKTDVVVQEELSKELDLPDFLQGYKGPIGTEDIQDEDVTIPRLKIGQSMSGEVKDGDIKEGSLYINVTGQAIWNPNDPPLEALIVAQSKEYILWRDLKDGGGLFARARPVKEGNFTRYKWDKPNQKFENKVGGKISVIWQTATYVDEDGLGEWGTEIPGNKDSRPAATETHNYLLMLPQHDNIVVAVSLAVSATKVAKNLNAALKLGNPQIPVPLRKWHIATINETSDNNEYKNWQFKPAGHLGRADADIAKLAMSLFNNYKKADYVVDQSDAKASGDKELSTDDEIPF